MGRKPHGRFRLKLGDNTEVDLTEARCEDILIE
jgi:hypothetical protein